ncbi:hypothetical protein RAS1_20470 [Phycisphaerae bacterium RAS1]|nr:hypothetical protein RAS1_20470 [Phycisphaerae bacterium RAS1]
MAIAVRRAGYSSLISLVVLSAAATRAQQPSSAPASAPAAAAQSITARVIDVKGDVKYAPLDSKEYKPCKVGDEYPEMTKILTGINSSVKFQIGDEEPYTAMVIDRVSKVTLSELAKTGDSKRVRVGVANGSIRAGVAEGGLKSDFTVDSPVATLSKKGTWGFGLYYERDTDSFEVSLLDQGLVEAFNKVTGGKRIVLPRELVTETMKRWLDQVQTVRNVAIADILGQDDMTVAFNKFRSDGLGVLNPGAGSSVFDLSNSQARQDFANLIRRTLPNNLASIDVNDLIITRRAEGFFGTGRGDQLIPLIIEQNSPLTQRGAARPGEYRFRRDALEGWLQQHGGK